MKDEALRLSLEALKTCQIDGDGWSGPDYWFDDKKVGKAIAAIKQALEETPCVFLEPEPVALLRSLGPKPWETSEVAHAQMKLILDFEKAYISPPKREPLTDEQLHALFDSPLTPIGLEWARKIEAAHGIKGEA